MASTKASVFGGLATVFIASASAIAASAMMINMETHYGSLHNSGAFKPLQQGTTVPHITLQNIKKTIVKFFLERSK